MARHIFRPCLQDLRPDGTRNGWRWRPGVFAGYFLQIDPRLFFPAHLFVYSCRLMAWGAENDRICDEIEDITAEKSGSLNILKSLFENIAT